MGKLEQKNLQKLFDLYSKICQPYFKSKTFEEHPKSFINLNVFVRFCKDFKVSEFNPHLIDNFDEGMPNVIKKINKYTNKNLRI